MTYPLKKFINDQDIIKIENAVKEAERQTSGEIVPMIVARSYHYPLSDVIGGFAFALPVALLLTYFIGGWLWIGHHNMWLFLGLITIFFICFNQTVKRIDSLKRFFISDKEIEEEVEEAAVTAFFREGLYRTKDETGILIFISVFERRVWVLADRGINAKVKEGEWDAIVRMITEGIKNKNQTDGICKAIGETARILKEHFPKKADDKDELKNLIVEGD
jgi:putative membrane protein